MVSDRTTFLNSAEDWGAECEVHNGKVEATRLIYLSDKMDIFWMCDECYYKHLMISKLKGEKL